MTLLQGAAVLAQFRLCARCEIDERFRPQKLQLSCRSITIVAVDIVNEVLKLGVLSEEVRRGWCLLAVALFADDDFDPLSGSLRL